MTSAGGLVPARPRPRAHPARLLLVGSGRWRAGRGRGGAACGFPDAVAFDMGGTSTDVCLVRGGVPAPSSDPSRSPASRSGSRRSPSTPSVPVVARSPARPGGRAGRRARRARARSRVRRATAGGDRGHGHRRRRRARAVIPAIELPGLGRARRRRGTRRARPRAGVTAPRRGRAVVDAAMARAVRVVTVEQGVDPRDLALVAFGGAGPLHACAVADELGMRTVVVPGTRRCVLRARDPLRARAAASWSRRGPIPRSRGRPRRQPATPLAERAPAPCFRAATSKQLARLPLRRAEPRAHRAPRSTTSRRARAAQRLRPPGCRRRGRRAPARVERVRRRSPCGTCLRHRARSVRGPAVGRRARLHGAGCPTGGSRPPGPDRRVDPGARREPGRAADPRVAARVDRRRDGRGAAARRVQPEHQGARRLLRRAVHRRRRAARPGRAHPGAPRVDAGVGRGRGRHRPATPSSCSTTRSRAARTSTTSRSSRRSRSTA